MDRRAVAGETIDARAVISGGRAAEPPVRAGDPRPSTDRPSTPPAGDHSVDLTGKKRRRHRRRRDRLPDRPDDRGRSITSPSSSAARPVDVPEPEPPRRGRTGMTWAICATPVLRTLVPLPAVLARLTTRGSRRRVDPAWEPSGALGEPGERLRPPDVHRVDQSQLGTVRPDRKVVPTILRPASARCRTTAAGSRDAEAPNVELVRGASHPRVRRRGRHAHGVKVRFADVVVFATGFRMPTTCCCR